jgi:lycopene cyclase domain-containing protein
MKSNYLYLFLDFISILFPFAFSFYPKANFSKKWKYLWPAIFITALIFILWDITFTQRGVWGFNPKYVIGVYFFNLPLEEVLFFVCIPYACVFLYEALKYLVKKDWLGNVAPRISIALCVLLISVGLFNIQRWYTSVTFIITSIFLATVQWKWNPTFMGRFYFSFLFVLIPFFIINGVLTGSFISEPVVWYDMRETLGIRMGTIPLEDIFYGMLLLLMNISMYENLQKPV